ncbi:putative zinc-binding peptidase [Bradyrhizobium sp. Tv2a-2]|uniref:zinc-binding metallopeptidase family protein n=1 Tax=Bradyrhizobium sp. Tv2a-2 TaxID=113395 RepID=UPI0004647379|nr:putative zinc-binding peptidase [Bradyrhizobium sp. Tv2a-2]
MKLFTCQACGNVLYFENRSCAQCGHRLGFMPEQVKLSAVEPDGERFATLADRKRARLFCANASHDACNWLVEPESGASYCCACRHNGIVPDLSNPDYLGRWRDLEIAKHRLFYSLIRWKLPVKTRAEDPAHGLIFNFLADDPSQRVMTGHDNGLITIALTEADDIEREKRRLEMREAYRTLLGHFRHEVGHYFWDVLVRDRGKLDACRAAFGDDTIDYGEALQRHYAAGPPPDWRAHFVSAYAATHPWEDFAETWAHYLHIIDTLEMASAFGIEVRPAADRSGGLSAHIAFDPYETEDFDAIVNAWLPFTFAMNSINRAMGMRDLYPFVLSPAVIEKLRFIHQLVQEQAHQQVQEQAKARRG